MRRDPFHFSPMGGLFVAWIAHDHSVLVESVQVELLSSVSRHRPRPFVEGYPALHIQRESMQGERSSAPSSSTHSSLRMGPRAVPSPIPHPPSMDAACPLSSHPPFYAMAPPHFNQARAH